MKREMGKWGEGRKKHPISLPSSALNFCSCNSTAIFQSHGKLLLLCQSWPLKTWFCLICPQGAIQLCPVPLSGQPCLQILSCVYAARFLVLPNGLIWAHWPHQGWVDLDPSVSRAQGSSPFIATAEHQNW